MAQNRNNIDDWKRIELVIRRSGRSTNAFAKLIGLPRGENLYQIKRGNNGMSRELAERICGKFPEISKLWLMTGDGKMLNDEACSPSENIPINDRAIFSFYGSRHDLIVLTAFYGILASGQRSHVGTATVAYAAELEAELLKTEERDVPECRN